MALPALTVVPPVPQFTNPVGGIFSGKLASLPIVFVFSPLVLIVLTMLVGIFVAALSVMLIYHWRRFPFEHDVFHRVERIYLTGVALLLVVVVFSILFAA
jgi:uncharacterized BrkB/YihY/UPF0761 family membrane protein